MPHQPDLTRTPDADALKSSPARGLAASKENESRVDRTGGDYGAGIIRGFATITRGEALGHDFWIDEEMVAATAAAINAAGKKGIKARFTHPGLSDDGLGKYLGRVKLARVDGDVARADLHLSKTSRKTPEGDLGAYVMQLAEEDPEAFGASIVFKKDREAEAMHFEANSIEEPHPDKPGKRRRFQSPDPRNTKHLRHARLKTLKAVDAVDSPAANPDGFFHATPIPAEADALLLYAAGLATEAPQLAALDLNPDRAAKYLRGFLTRHNLSILPAPHFTNEPMSKKADQATPESQADQPAELSAAAPSNPPAAPPSEQSQAKRFLEAYGQAGPVWFAEGKTFEEAAELHRVEALAAKDAEIASLTKERDELKARIAGAQLGEAAPVSTGAAPAAADDDKTAKLKNACGEKVGAYAASLKLRSK